MYRVDITADLNDEDETGYVWTFLDEARDSGQIKPGAIIVAGDEDTGLPSPRGTGTSKLTAARQDCSSSPVTSRGWVSAQRRRGLAE